ncbi:hypothetical protein EJ03DRAFT_331059 [Teratosphaeria nubilosa]|uniref:Uncharacterized protein n=1 Tax=Teratosphaeria nubilosa TaxID=161662 RepID=A0A6G1KZ38_9PEZI|nr:hypothetical protein EJ03DRAFT_331059 [Teratosphaeria nubilosa]
MDSRPCTSSSKRKRDRPDDDDQYLQSDDHATHTPKRTRSSAQRNDLSTSDETSTPGNKRGLRRKKKHNNLSNLNLRHAAERQRAAEQTLRESKFQEGSLTDKPSEKPPSAYTRIIRTDSGNLVQVDQLMEDYHGGVEDTSTPVQTAVAREKNAMSQQVNEIAAENARKEDGGIFRFGRSLATGFHPITLWNKLWNDTKDELTQRNYEEAMRRRQKEEAEARYALMKQAGQFGLRPVGRTGADTHDMDNATPAVDSARSSRDPAQRPLPANGTSQLAAPKEEDEGDQPESTIKGNRTLRSRFSFKRPSISNLKEGLFRVKSDFNLAAAAASSQEPSSSLSPAKDEFHVPGSSIRRSTSRFDLKKQNKLSKRVSDLETKLQRARLELDEALVQASPAPKFKNKYERFTPQSTVKRHPKFIPGALPSLPSERLLMAREAFGDDEASPEAMESSSRVKPRTTLDMTEAMELDEEDADVGALKAAQLWQYPRRAESLFSLANRNIEHMPPVEDEPVGQDQVLEGNIKTTPVAMEQPARDVVFEPEAEATAAISKPARKAGRSKKRKSGDDGDKAFKPGKDTTSDDDEFIGETKNKRKSSSTKNNGSSPGRKTRATAAGASSSPKGKKTSIPTAEIQETVSKQTTDLENPTEEMYSADENDEGEDDAGLDGVEGTPLSPVLEEEGVASTTSVQIPVNSEPSRPTATATPARYGLPTARSLSPHGRAGSVQPPGIEEQILKGAAAAVHNRRALRPPPDDMRVYTEATESETVGLNPGDKGVPKTVHSKHDSMDLVRVQESAAAAGSAKKVVLGKGGVELGKRKEDFQWPDDVF